MAWHLTTAQRVANAKKARMTERARGELPFGGKHGNGGWGHMTPEQRHLAAEKRIATMKAKGEKIGFARLTPEQRHLDALKAAKTRAAKGEKPFGGKRHRGWHLTPAERVEAAKKAAATRRARHER